ncbi:copper homeostasis protein CutC [Zhouia sp. PK063]|uniref:copper homeostasis protein CutC n=1 Tax=Zhouia sp. PK063 TaxID=3373602 RepID=UPI0037B20615
MKFELCIASYEEALMAQKYKAYRIEVCAALEIGGITPSYGFIKSCCEIEGPEKHIMIRPRGGHFEYTPDEVHLMLENIEVCKALNATGVVFGALTENLIIDKETTGQLTEKAKSLGLQTTFHRAFDFVKKPIQNLEILIDFGIDNLLTSGLEPTAIQGKKTILSLLEHANKQIHIIAGSGVHANNVVSLLNTGVHAVHFTARKPIFNSVGLKMGDVFEPDEDKIQKIISKTY